jgi:hypothetical protein
VRLGVVFLASAIAAAVVPGATGSPALRSRGVHFTTLWHAAGEGTGRYYGGPRVFPDGTYVVRRVVDAQFLAPAVVSNARLARLDRFPWSKRFLMLAVVVRPTTGYSPTIRRVTYQRVSAEVEQLCVVVDIKKPRAGSPVERRRTVSFHAVSIPRGSFGLTPPVATVTVDPRGRILLRTSSHPVRPAACRGS